MFFWKVLDYGQATPDASLSKYDLFATRTNDNIDAVHLTLAQQQHGHDRDDAYRDHCHCTRRAFSAALRMAAQMDFELLRRHSIDCNTDRKDRMHLHMCTSKGGILSFDMDFYAEGIATLTTRLSPQSTPTSCCPS